MAKENLKELTDVNPRDYYSSLTRKERSKLLAFLVGRFGMSYSTATQKLSGHAEMKQTDIVLFNLAIQNEGEWKE